MNLFRLAFAISVALILPFGPSATATTEDPPPPPSLTNSHPPFSITEDRALDFWETSSRLLFETIEDILRHGGLVLFDEGFQIDSSLSFGESIQGEIDAVVPLWRDMGEDGYTGVVFAQPGFTFWTGIGDEGRIDTNLGVVYRTNLLNTPVGFDAIGGASIFYDSNFRRGHSRISLGVDAQHKEFHGGVNYYQPVSDEVEGRAGYIEDAVRGIDARLEFQRDIMRVRGNLGLWRYDGISGKSDWKSSYGLDAGVEISDGIFIEGGYEKHDEDKSIGDRLSLGVAFKYSLPDFEGRSYGESLMSSDFYKLVDREKRVLYEERMAVTGPSVSIARDSIVRDGVKVRGENVIEGDTVKLDIRLSDELEEDVTLNLVGDGTASNAATYGASNDWILSVGSMDCVEVTEDNCQVGITAGQTIPNDDVVITINDDGRTNEPAEDINLSMEVASAGDTNLAVRGSFALTISADPPLPTVSLSSDDTNLQEGGMATITLTLSESLGRDATFNLIGSSESNDVTYGTSADWNLSVGGNDCNMASRSNPCTVVVLQGDTTAEVSVETNTDLTDEGNEAFTVSVEVDSGSMDIVLPGSSSSVDFTIRHPGGTIGIPSNLARHTLEEGMDVGLELEVNNTGALAAILDNNITLTRTITITGDEESTPDASNDITFDAIEIDASLGNANATVSRISVTDDIITENEEVVTLTLTDDNNVLPTGWSIDSNNSTITITIPANDQPGPVASIVRTGNETIEEGGTIALDVQLSGRLQEDVIINLVESGTAEYGSSKDYTVSVGGTDCTGITGNNCQVTITAGQTSPSGNVVIAINEDGRGEHAETIVLSMVIASAGNTGLMARGSLSFTIPADPPLATVSLSADSASIEEGGTAILMLTLSERLESPVIFNLVGGGTGATYGTSSSSDWNLDVGGTDCTMATRSSPCQVMISQGTSAQATVEISDDMTAEVREEFTVSVEVDSASRSLVELGSSSSQDFTIPANDNKVSIDLSMSGSTVDENGGTANVVVTVNEPYPTEDIVLNVSRASSSTETTHFTLSSSTLTIPAGQSSGMITVTGVNNSTTETTARTIVLNLTGNLPAGWGFDPTGPLTHTITIIDDEAPTISLSAPTSSLATGASTTITLTLGRPLENNATFNLTGASNGPLAQYGTAAGWHLTVDGKDCESATPVGPCKVTIDADETTADVTVTVNNPGRRNSEEKFTVSVMADSGNADTVELGSPSMLEFTIPADPPLPTVSLSADTRSIAEGKMATITLTLSETLTSDATFSLIGVREGSTATAEYGTDKDWNLSVDETDCNASSNTTDCQITIKTDGTTATATVKVHTDTVVEAEETFTVSVEVGDSRSRNLVTEGTDDSLDFTIPADPLPTVNLSSDKTSVREKDTATITLTLSQALTMDATFNLIGSGGAAYGTFGDWNLSVNDDVCDMALQSDPCQVIIKAGATTAKATVKIVSDTRGRTISEDFTVSVAVDSGSASLVEPGSKSSLNFTIPANKNMSLRFKKTGETVNEDVHSVVILGFLTDDKGAEARSYPAGGLPVKFTLMSGESDDIEITGPADRFMGSAGGVITSVVITDDNIVEDKEVFVIKLDKNGPFPEGWDIDMNANTFTITINESDQPVTLSGGESIAEGSTATITLTLAKALGSDVTFNLTSGGTEADYGTDKDWNLSVGGADCDTATESDPCSVTIPAGQNSVEVTVEANTDSDVESRENFTVSVAADPRSAGIVTVPDASDLDFSVSSQITASLNYSGSRTISINGNNRMAINLDEALDEPVTLEIAVESDATYGNPSAGGVWLMLYHFVPAGESLPDSFPNRGHTTCQNIPCQITIPKGGTIVDISFSAYEGASNETLAFSLNIPQASADLISLGSPTSHSVGIN